MSADLYRDPSHSEMISLLCTRFNNAGYQVYSELPLPNGRRADVVVSRPTGLAIIEVKADLRWRHFVEADRKYGDFANCLYIASPLPEQYLPPLFGPLSIEAAACDHIGVWQVEWHRTRKIRSAAWRIAAAGPLTLPSAIERSDRGVALSGREADV